MPIGVIVDCAATAVGGLLGAILGKYIPEKIKSFLPVVFSVCCLGIGISLIVQAKSLSAVMLSVILGAVVGAIIDIDNFFKVCVDKAQAKLSGSGSTYSTGWFKTQAFTVKQAGTLRLWLTHQGTRPVVQFMTNTGVGVRTMNLVTTETVTSLSGAASGRS